MMLLFRKEKWNWEPGDLTESVEELRNPARGWYRIYPFCVEAQPALMDAEAGMEREESLVLVILDLHAYRTQRIDEAGLLHMNQILRFFTDRGKDMILRAVYDREGNGLQREPDSFAQVKEHFQQIAELAAAYADHILIYQGMLLGSWGEMHTSRFLTRENLRELYAVYEAHTGGRPFLAVRRPMYWRQLHSRKIYENLSFGLQIGLFDDGILGSSSNLGTFGVKPRENAGWWEAWKPEDELEFEAALCRYVPNGGEAVLEETAQGSDAGSLQRAADRLRRMHVTYLNRLHDARLLELWASAVWEEKGVWNGISGLDYIGRHLGYRFCIRSISVSHLKKEQYQITVQIENLGFANFYQEAEAVLIRKGSDGTELQEPLDWDIRTWDCGIRRTETVTLIPKEEMLYLAVRRKQDGRPIRFANPAEADGRIRLGRFMRP